MLKTLPKLHTKTKVTDGVIATLAFFSLYKLPLSASRVWELLYKIEANFHEVEGELARLHLLGVINCKDGLFALEDWDSGVYQANQQEIEKRWRKIKKYYWALSSIPFIESISVINSVAMGNADSESDIDFFIITKPNRLYFVRTWVILLFKFLGVYKNRTHTNERFCFGFYITSDALSIKSLLLTEEDPYLTFWLATIIPITGERIYEKFMKENRWIYSWLPNFRTEQRLAEVRKLKSFNTLRTFLSGLAAIPAFFMEPILRRIHVRHTFKLPENHWKTSSTIANNQMLKLHALDPRRDLRQKFREVLQNYK